MKRWLALCLALMMVVSICGCSDGSSGAGSTSETSETSETSTVSESQSAENTEGSDEVIRIAFSIPVASAPYWTAVGYGVHKAVDELNKEAGKTVAEYQFFNPGNFELETQLKNIEDALALEFDGMIVAPVDTNGTAPAIENAAGAGMTICTVDLQAETDAILAGFCTYNYEAGITNAETMAELIYEKNGAYEGNVVMNMGRANISSHAARRQGFIDTMESKYPDIKIIFQQFAEKTEENVTVIENAIAAHGDAIDAVFVTGDNAAHMACQAIESAGMMKPVGEPDHIIIVGFDGEINGIQNIRDGKQDATVAQNPIVMGSLAARAIYEYETNGTVPEVDDEGQVEVPHFAITYKNIDSEEAAEFFWSLEVEDADIEF